jgi:outer membrane protein assembly factor BamD (BamD/ComL family)
MRIFVPNFCQMKIRFLHIAIVLLLTLSANSLPAQKHIANYDPEALYDQGLTLFNHGEYGAALESFSKYLDLVEDKKLQKAVDAQYYVAVSSLYAGQSDA